MEIIIGLLIVLVIAIFVDAVDYEKNREYLQSLDDELGDGKWRK